MTDFDNIAVRPLSEIASACIKRGQDILLNPTQRDRQDIGYLFLCVGRLMRESEGMADRDKLARAIDPGAFDADTRDAIYAGARRAEAYEAANRVRALQSKADGRGS